MKPINKITLINIYITNRVLHNRFERGMEDDLKAIEIMFENNDFRGLDSIYRKYFIPDLEEAGFKKRKSSFLRRLRKFF